MSKSSVGWLVLALCACAAAGLSLLAGFAAARRRTGPGAASTGAGGTVDLTNGHVPAGQAVYLVPVAAGSIAGMAGVAAPVAATPASGGAPLVGYDSMTASQVVQLVRSGVLSDEQLAAIADHERRTHGRKTVLDALGRR